MKINEFVTESTTSGAIATVATPMTTQKRSGVGKGVYANEKPGSLLTGKKTNKKYANSINESRIKQLISDLEELDNGNFQKKYKKSKQEMKFFLNAPEGKKTVHEAHLEEDDLIIVPGQGHRLKSGFIPHDKDRTDHEVEMAKSDLFQAAKNAKQVYEMIADVSEEEGLEGWVQEKIIKANDYLNTIREYLEGKRVQEMTGGVVAGGGVGESIDSSSGLVEKVAKAIEGPHKAVPADSKYSLEELRDIKWSHLSGQERSVRLNEAKSAIDAMNSSQQVDEEGKGLWANIHAKRERIKHGSGERMRKPGSKGAPSAQNFRDASK